MLQISLLPGFPKDRVLSLVMSHHAHHPVSLNNLEQYEMAVAENDFFKKILQCDKIKKQMTKPVSDSP